MTSPLDPNHRDDEVHLAETAERLGRRPWLTTPLKDAPTLSFEFFPPSSRAAWNQLADTVDKLAPFGPAFSSVTYGAGGSTRHRTQRAVETLHAAYDMAIASHLTCVATTKATVHGILDDLAETGVRRIVALRGDMPNDIDGPIPDGYRSAADLVAAIRARADGDMWDISVAGYPEVHPMAASRSADLDALRRKVDAGADRVITQFFFDNDDFFRFAEEARRAGVDVPIVPGVMPVHDFDGAVRFAGRCGAKIPVWMQELFGPIDDEAIRRLVAATVTAEQVRGLVEWGVQHLHLYTLNRADLTEAVLRMSGHRTAAADEPAAPPLHRVS